MISPLDVSITLIKTGLCNIIALTIVIRYKVVSRGSKNYVLLSIYYFFNVMFIEKHN